MNSFEQLQVHYRCEGDAHDEEIAISVLQRRPRHQSNFHTITRSNAGFQDESGIREGGHAYDDLRTPPIEPSHVHNNANDSRVADEFICKWRCEHARAVSRSA